MPYLFIAFLTDRSAEQQQQQPPQWTLLYSRGQPQHALRLPRRNREQDRTQTHTEVEKERETHKASVPASQVLTDMQRRPVTEAASGGAPSTAQRQEIKFNLFVELNCD